MANRARWARPEWPGLTTLLDLLAWTREDHARRLCAKRDGRWTGRSGAEFHRDVLALAASLAAQGVRAGDRVAILAESSPEWLIADFACLAAGVIDVPIYPTLTAGQAAYVLRDSGAVGVFVSNAAQAAKVESVRAGLPELRWIRCMEREDWRALPDGAAGPHAARPEDVATLLYTSGTTGEPKGVPLTHANLCANLNVSTIDFDYCEDDRRLSILPLSHITERHIAYVDMMYGAATYFAESLDTVAQDLLEVHPTVLVAVPRLFEKVAAGVRAQAAQKPALARAIFAWALRVGANPARGRLAEALARRLVWSKLHARMGGALRIVVAGGAPLGKELAEFLLSMGLVVDEGYGMTETAPVIALNRPGGRRPGSVGRPLPTVEVRFAADGELLVRGPSVFGGYYRLPAATAEALDADGWFHTGDIGHQDADGFLFLTDRKKDLIKTSGGKFIAPQPIEAALKTSPLIAEAVVVGDGRNYAAALLVPNWAALPECGAGPAGRAAACADAAVRARFQAEVDRVNASLARFETIKTFALLPEEFSVAAGELTPTVKVRRRTVCARYAAVIDGLYASPPRPA